MNDSAFQKWMQGIEQVQEDLRRRIEHCQSQLKAAHAADPDPRPICHFTGDDKMTNYTTDEIKEYLEYRRLDAAWRKRHPEEP